MGVISRRIKFRKTNHRLNKKFIKSKIKLNTNSSRFKRNEIISKSVKLNYIINRLDRERQIIF